LLSKKWRSREERKDHLSSLPWLKKQHWLTALVGAIPQQTLLRKPSAKSDIDEF
jgi:hypothetical protein